MTLFVALLLHIYQPPTQTAAILKKISKESYKPLIKMLQRNQAQKLTLNINGSLTELLELYDEQEITNGIISLSKQKQIELTGTSCYHAILPLIPIEEITRQINLNDEIQKRILKDAFQPKGFWLPEMAYDIRVIEPISKSNYEWTVLSSVASPDGELPNNYIPYLESGFITYFRNDLLSNLISFRNPSVEEFIDELTKGIDYLNEDSYIILAMDGETYGHHVKGLIESFLEPFLKKILDNPNMMLVTISELSKYFNERKIVFPVSSSWSTTAEEIQRGVPFPLWLDPENEIHKLQHIIMNHAVFLVSIAKKHYNNGCHNDNETNMRFVSSRSWLDKGLHSCQLWWASKKPWYSAEMILKGLNQLIIASSEALKVILKYSNDNFEKEKAKNIFDEIFEAQKQLYLMV
ncbi:MAG: hypothetical protein ACFFDW_07370 [Candidatus Thorarchaeota archaeon]